MTRWGTKDCTKKNETLADPKYDGRINILCGCNGNKSPMRNVRRGVHVRAALTTTIFVLIICPDHHNTCVSTDLFTTVFVFAQPCSPKYMFQQS